MPRPLQADLWRFDIESGVRVHGPNSRTERLRETKIGTEVAHVTRDSDTTFKIKRSYVNLQGAGHIVAASRTAIDNTQQCAAIFNGSFVVCWSQSVVEVSTESRAAFVLPSCSSDSGNFRGLPFGFVGASCPPCWSTYDIYAHTSESTTQTIHVHAENRNIVPDHLLWSSDVNKDWTCKDKDKHQAYKDQNKDKD